MPLIISPEQAGFVESKQILDGIIIIHETIHSVKIGKIPGMLLKLDLSKAYDKINWKFLVSMLKAFGFSDQWIMWVMNLVSSAFFSILVNRSPAPPFQSTRGIRKAECSRTWQNAQGPVSRE